MFFATPRLRWNCVNRVSPSNASRKIRSVHLSPTTSTVRATGHVDRPRRVLTSTTPPPMNWLHFATSRPMVWFQSSTTSPRVKEESRSDDMHSRLRPTGTPEHRFADGPLLAFVSGAAVANVYYAQPLLDDLGAQLQMSPAALGWVTTATQGGYL